MKKSIAFVPLLLCLFACSQKAPKCSDGDVKKLVIETSQELVEKKMIKNFLEKNMNEFSNVLNKNETSDSNLIAKIIYGQIPTLNDLKASNTPKIKEYVRDIESKCSKLSIESIRTSSKDDVAKKCSCEGDVIVTPEIKIPIRYNAQKTDDGKIRVEVNMQ